MTVKGFAPAKINLTLHVTGQRDDGFHTLDSLVVFGAARDQIIVREARELSLTVEGPEAANVPPGQDNLVMRAAGLMAKGRGAAITLIKNLPVASGIGGGSADAAATLRALSQFWGEPLPKPGEILNLGADVPVCMGRRPTRMAGIGEVLSPAPDMPEYLGMVLVNPRVSVPTPEIFRRLENKCNPAMPDVIPTFGGAQGLADWLTDQRNDLEVPAISVQPVIGDVLQAIKDTGSLIARMSGSGATCFGLFETEYQAKAARAKIYATHPEWWGVWFGLNPVELNPN